MLYVIGVSCFDHHCKYLNSCVSKTRNYVPFLMCVVSAVAAVLVILAAALAQIILFYVNPSWLNLWDNSTVILQTKNDDESSVDDFATQINEIFNATAMWNDTLSIENSTLSNSTKDNDGNGLIENDGIGLYNTIFLAIVAIVAILASVTAGLLLHLCFFHVYICYLGLTTYEYIRNHRVTSIATTTTTNGPSLNHADNNKTFAAKEIYLCSKLKSSDLRHRPKTLYCCEKFDDNADNNVTISNSLENSTTATTVSQKAFYVCTVLEERTTTTAAAAVSEVLNANDSNIHAPTETAASQNATRTLHCCSEFSHITKSQNGIQKIIQYTEQCAFCSFRIRNPRKLEHQKQRCCIMKTNIGKHHRWRRKWNCCSNVPNSPEDFNSGPGNVLHTIYNNNQPSVSTSISSGVVLHHNQQQHQQNKPNYVQIEIPIESCANNNLTTNNYHHSDYTHHHHVHENNGTTNLTHENMKSISTIATTSSSSNIDSISSSKINNTNNMNVKRTRSKLVRPWPVMRLRHVFHMINRYRRPRCRNVGTPKQNQVRPLSGSISNDNINGCNNNIHNNSDFIQHSNVAPNAPAPNRRKLKSSSPTDLQDLADSLSIIQPSSNIHVPPLQNVRRPRRKNVLRNKSPTLSPIHESGFSNPTSPQLACRHACSGSIPSIGHTTAALCGNNQSKKNMEN